MRNVLFFFALAICVMLGYKAWTVIIAVVWVVGYLTAPPQHRLSGDGVIPACDGLDEISVEIRQVGDNFTFRRLFRSFRRDLHDLQFSREQVEQFCRSCSNWLSRERSYTMFLVNDSGELKVAAVGLDSTGRVHTHWYPYRDENTWFAVHKHRVVIPKED